MQVSGGRHVRAGLRVADGDAYSQEVRAFDLVRGERAERGEVTEVVPEVPGAGPVGDLLGDDAALVALYRWLQLDHHPALLLAQAVAGGLLLGPGVHDVAQFRCGPVVQG